MEILEFGNKSSNKIVLIHGFQTPYQVLKDYIDYKDIVFKDAEMSEVVGDDGELELINLTLIGQSILEQDIDAIINKYFRIQ